MEIVVKGRNVEVPDHYREHVAEKLDKAVRLDRKIMTVDVELLHERNPRQQGHCQRVEITWRTRGPVVRAEASARDFYSALDEAANKLTTRLRRAADRRRVHRPRRGPVSVADATAGPAVTLPDGPVAAPSASAPAGPAVATAAPEQPARHTEPADAYDAGLPDDQPWRIVREKEHPGDPMTVEDALFHMELLGHDFYLFQDKDSGRPTVVYRRRAFDYGVIGLAPPAG